MNIIEQIDLKFKSGNAIPVDRVNLTLDEWKQIKEIVAKARSDAGWVHEAMRQQYEENRHHDW